jgi:hypothetical protein
MQHALKMTPSRLSRRLPPLNDVTTAQELCEKSEPKVVSKQRAKDGLSKPLERLKCFLNGSDTRRQHMPEHLDFLQTNAGNIANRAWRSSLAAMGRRR